MNCKMQTLSQFNWANCMHACRLLEPKLQEKLHAGLRHAVVLLLFARRIPRSLAPMRFGSPHGRYPVGNFVFQHFVREVRICSQKSGTLAEWMI